MKVWLLLAGLLITIGGAAPVVWSNVGSSTQETRLSPVEATALGVIEGITEYLPVSSTGHLTVATRLMGLDDTPKARRAIDAYVVVIQLGAILAVLIVFWRRILDLLLGLVGKSESGRRILTATVVAFVPAAVVGVVLGDAIKSRLFGPGPIAAAWIAGGILILFLTERLAVARERGAPLEEIDYRQALIIGIAQGAALWPGVSRSLVTIVAAVLVGLSLSAAVEFSFILGLATLGAATVYEIAKDGSLVTDTFGVTAPLIGLAFAAVSAAFAIRWLVSFVANRDLRPFGYYRIAIGVATFGLMAGGVL